MEARITDIRDPETTPARERRTPVNHEIVICTCLILVLVALLALQRYLLVRPDVRTSVDRLQMSTDALQIVLILFASPIVAAFIVVMLVARSQRRAGPLAQALKVDPLPFAFCFIVSAIVSAVLSYASIWPWSFASPLSHSREISSFIVNYHQSAAGLVWVIVATLMVPLLEEVLYRFGLLRWLEHLTGSALVAVAGSSIVFGAAHFSFVDPFGRRNAIFTCLMGLASSLLVKRTGGNLTCAVAIHSGRNMMEVFLLFSVAIVSN